IQRKRLSVPADAPVQESAAVTRRRILVERELDAPVMRHAQTAPTRIVKRGLLGTRSVTTVEFPTIVEALAALAVVGLNESASASRAAARASTRASRWGTASAAGRFSTRARVCAARRASAAAARAALRVARAAAIRAAASAAGRFPGRASVGAAGRASIGA